MTTTQELSNIKTSLPLEIKQHIFYKALLIRKVEETLLEMYSKGELQGTIHTCIGQELTGVIVSEFLGAQDAVFSNHRCHGHFIAFTDEVTDLIAEIAGKVSGVCGGRGGSQHLYKNSFYSNGIQGGNTPISAGMAWSKKIKKIKGVVVVYIGDGTLGEGVLYETFNMASLLGVPLLFVLENNRYAQSTHQSETLAGNICSRAEAFNIRAVRANTWDWESLYSKTKDLINYVREESKPAFLQVDTYRLMAHSKGDDNRDKDEVAYYQRIDPLNLYILNNENNYFKMMCKINLRIKKAVLTANQTSYPTTFLPQPVDFKPLKSVTYQKNNKEKRLSHAINEALLQIMSDNKKILLIGEDVKSPYGGAFKISQGLSEKLPDQVFNMPISEAGIVGLGCGLALDGFKPMIEIMFGDFIVLALDQILNHASKFRYMYNEQVKAPIVIRTPMGGGRGYGPTHSQTLDRHLVGIPGLTVVAINNLIAPHLVYHALVLNNEDPVVVIENKVLYTKMMRLSAPPGFYFEYTTERFPVVTMLPESKTVEVTIIGYGGLSDVLVDVVETLFYLHDIIGQLICPTKIYPYNIKHAEQHIKKSRFVFVVEEGQGFAGFGAEIIAQLVACTQNSSIIFQRIFPPAISIPASKCLEDATLPNKNNIIQSILTSFYEHNDAFKAKCK